MRTDTQPGGEREGERERKRERGREKRGKGEGEARETGGDGRRDASRYRDASELSREKKEREEEKNTQGQDSEERADPSRARSGGEQEGEVRAHLLRVLAEGVLVERLHVRVVAKRPAADRQRRHQVYVD